MSIIHISDLHLHGDDEKNKAVVKRMDTIKKRYPDDLVIATGDITDDGSEEQYKKIKWEFTACPGNHDYCYAGNFFFADKPELYKKYVTYTGWPAVRIIDGVRFIGLDSCTETYSPFDFARGKIGDAQLNTLDRLLSDRKPTVVYLHHHPFQRNPTEYLVDTNKLCEVIYGRIDVLLFGHRHIPEIWADNTNGYSPEWCKINPAMLGIQLISAAGKVEQVDRVLRFWFDDNGKVKWEHISIV